MSNPRLQLELPRLGALHEDLLERAAVSQCELRTAPALTPPVLPTVTQVLAATGTPMRACEIHRAAEQLAGEALRWTSVKAALAAATAGPSPRFERVAYGVYRSAS